MVDDYAESIAHGIGMEMAKNHFATMKLIALLIGVMVQKSIIYMMSHLRFYTFLKSAQKLLLDNTPKTILNPLQRFFRKVFGQFFLVSNRLVVLPPPLCFRIPNSTFVTLLR